MQFSPYKSKKVDLIPTTIHTGDGDTLGIKDINKLVEQYTGCLDKIILKNSFKISKEETNENFGYFEKKSVWHSKKKGFGYDSKYSALFTNEPFVKEEEINKKCVLFVGPSGCGKTCTLFNLGVSRGVFLTYILCLPLPFSVKKTVTVDDVDESFQFYFQNFSKDYNKSKPEDAKKNHEDAYHRVSIYLGLRLYILYYLIKKEIVKTPKDYMFAQLEPKNSGFIKEFIEKVSTKISKSSSSIFYSMVHYFSANDLNIEIALDEVNCLNSQEYFGFFSKYRQSTEIEVRSIFNVFVGIMLEVNQLKKFYLSGTTFSFNLAKKMGSHIGKPVKKIVKPFSRFPVNETLEEVKKDLDKYIKINDEVWNRIPEEDKKFLIGRKRLVSDLVRRIYKDKEFNKKDIKEETAPQFLIKLIEQVKDSFILGLMESIENSQNSNALCLLYILSKLFRHRLITIPYKFSCRNNYDFTEVGACICVKVGKKKSVEWKIVDNFIVEAIKGNEFEKIIDEKVGREAFDPATKFLSTVLCKEFNDAKGTNFEFFFVHAFLKELKKKSTKNWFDLLSPKDDPFCCILNLKSEESLKKIKKSERKYYFTSEDLKESEKDVTYYHFNSDELTDAPILNPTESMWDKKNKGIFFKPPNNDHRDLFCRIINYDEKQEVNIIFTGSIACMDKVKKSKTIKNFAASSLPYTYIKNLESLTKLNGKDFKEYKVIGESKKNGKMKKERDFHLEILKKINVCIRLNVELFEREKKSSDCLKDINYWRLLLKNEAFKKYANENLLEVVVDINKNNFCKLFGEEWGYILDILEIVSKKKFFHSFNFSDSFVKNLKYLYKQSYESIPVSCNIFYGDLKKPKKTIKIRIHEEQKVEDIKRDINRRFIEKSLIVDEILFTKFRSIEELRENNIKEFFELAKNGTLPTPISVLMKKDNSLLKRKTDESSTKNEINSIEGLRKKRKTKENEENDDDIQDKMDIDDGDDDFVIE